jgi:hypothetical protein
VVAISGFHAVVFVVFPPRDNNDNDESVTTSNNVKNVDTVDIVKSSLFRQSPKAEIRDILYNASTKGPRASVI